MENNNMSLYLYTQLTDQLIHSIKQMAIHEKLKSERELCNVYHVSRSTVRKSLAELEDLGYIYRRHGKGTFVSGLWRRKQNLLDTYNFNDYIKHLGKMPSNQIVSFEIIKAHREIALYLNIEENDDVYKIKRIRFSDGEAMLFETSYLPAVYFPDLSSEAVHEKGLYNVLENTYHQKIVYADEVFSAGQIGDNSSDKLDQPVGTPCLNIRRQTYNHLRQVIELTFTVARSDQFSYTVRHFNHYVE